MCLGLSAVKEISFSATHYVQARGARGSFCLYCCSLSYGELSTNKGGQWSTTANLFCEQVIARGRGSLSVTREGYLGGGTCYTKTPSLLLSSYSCGFNPTSSSIATLES